MSQQTSGQRWCSLVLLALFLSLFMYFGLPALAYRIGRSIEAGMRDAVLPVWGAATEEPVPDQRAAPFVRASRDVRPAVVRIDAFQPQETSAGDAAVESSGAVRALRISRGCGSR